MDAVKEQGEWTRTSFPDQFLRHFKLKAPETFLTSQMFRYQKMKPKQQPIRGPKSQCREISLQHPRTWAPGITGLYKERLSSLLKCFRTSRKNGFKYYCCNLRLIMHRIHRRALHRETRTHPDHGTRKCKPRQSSGETLIAHLIALEAEPVWPFVQAASSIWKAPFPLLISAHVIPSKKPSQKMAPLPLPRAGWTSSFCESSAPTTMAAHTHISSPQAQLRTGPLGQSAYGSPSSKPRAQWGHRE